MGTIEVPDQLLQLLEESRIGARSAGDRVRAALAAYLFQEGLISVGRAAELAGIPRIEFEVLLGDMGIPSVQYDVVDYERDKRGIANAERPRLP